MASFAQTVIPGKLEVIDLADRGVNGFAIELVGAIAAPLAQEYAAALATIPAGKTVYLGFDSSGGTVDEGKKIIEVLRAEKRAGREFVSLVVNGEVCASMCVPIYVQAQERRAGEMAVFMFHGTYDASWTNVPNVTRTKALLQYFLDAGVSESFLNDLWSKGAFSDPGEYWMSGRDLWDAKSGVLTRLQSRHRKFEPWRAPFDPNIRPR